jgi:hypothetical protein
MTVAEVRALPIASMEPTVVGHPSWCDKGDGERCDVVDDTVKHHSRLQKWIPDGDGEVEVVLCLERWDYLEIGEPQGRTEVSVLVRFEDLECGGEPVEMRLTREDALFLARQLVTASKGAMTQAEVDADLGKRGRDFFTEPAGAVYEGWKAKKLAEGTDLSAWHAEWMRTHPDED